MLLCCCLSLSLDPPSLNPAGVVGCCVASHHLLLLQLHLPLLLLLLPPSSYSSMINRFSFMQSK
jgi:hypothetical protein